MARPLITRRLHWLVLGGGVLAAAAASAALAAAPAASSPAFIETANAAAVPAGGLALGYQPGSEPGERRIAAAQARVSKRPDAVAHAQLALAFLQRKRETSDAAHFEYALDAVAAARQLDDHSYEVLAVRILTAQDAHRFAEARDLARAYIAAEPDESTGHLLLGDALLELGDYDDATAAYQRALDLRPDLRSYNRAAHLRWLRGDLAGAKRALELAIEAGSPRDPEAIAWCYVDLGAMYLEAGDAKRAVFAAERARHFLADYVPALVLEGRGRALAGERDAAIALLERATQRLPHVADLLLLSELYAEAGQSAASAARLEAAERLGEADPRPLALYYARHDVEHARALELAELELAARRNIEAWGTLALARLRAGRVAEAADAIEQALALGTRRAELHLHRGLILLAQGDHAGAAGALAEARAHNPHADPLLTAELERGLTP
jgi:tetratricopeptide (TPR) repeat protein